MEVNDKSDLHGVDAYRDLIRLITDFVFDKELVSVTEFEHADDGQSYKLEIIARKL